MPGQKMDYMIIKVHKDWERKRFMDRNYKKSSFIKVNLRK